MKVGLVDVDGHHFPNLALMRISAWHKKQGDKVEWWMGDLFHYNRVYMSKIFSDAYSREKYSPENADEVIRGGTGYAIRNRGGVEVFDKSMHSDLPEEIERMFPDYSIYPQYDFAVSMTSRGCFRRCNFCHVGAKEGFISRKVANVEDFYNGQREIKVLDPNITACRDKHELFEQYIETKALIDFSQGLDIRLLSGQDIEFINKMRVKMLHFAWDDPDEDLEQKFSEFAKGFRRKTDIGTVYCLTNFGPYTEDEHIDRALTRIYKLRDMGYKPYVMIYDKPNATQRIVDLQGWCNNKLVFNSTERFEEYIPKRKGVIHWEPRLSGMQRH